MAHGSTEQTTPAEGQDQAAATTPATEPVVTKKASGGKIKNKTMAGQCVFAVSGHPIDFDEKGVASVEGPDFDYLAQVPGYEKA